MKGRRAGSYHWFSLISTDMKELPHQVLMTSQTRNTGDNDLAKTRLDQRHPC